MPLQTLDPAQQKKMAAVGSFKYPDRLQFLTGMLEVKFKSGAFATWSDAFVRLEGRWISVHKKERDPTRMSAVELGPGVQVTDLTDAEASTKFPRRFDIMCKGGLLPSTEISFRTRSRKDRDLWVLAIATNIHLLEGVGLDPAYAVMDLDPVVSRMKETLPLTPIRIRSDLSVRCASGESLVQFLVSEELAMDRAHANLICRRMMSMNILHHVVWEKDFVDGMEYYTISEMDDETNYESEHFQKYMDSRKFWKFFDHDGSSSTGSGRSARQLRSTGSSGVSATHHRNSMTTMSTTSVDNMSHSAASTAAIADKKAKKCSVCSKSFNPLRRRYSCRICTAVVCSHCSMARKVETEDDGSVNARVCVSCKLGSANTQDDFYDRIFAAPPSITASSSDVSSTGRQSGVSANGSLPPTAPPASAECRRKSSAVQAAPASQLAPGFRDSLSASSISALVDCHLCMNEGCAPLRDVAEVPYPVTTDEFHLMGSNQFLIAGEMDKEQERMRYVRVIHAELDANPAARLKIENYCNMAAIATGCPASFVGLLDSDEYDLVGTYGPDNRNGVPRESSVAAHTCRNGSPLVCCDMTEDVRFAGNPIIRDQLKMVFYAGIPLTLSSGHTVGCVEVMDDHVRYVCTEIIDQLQAVVRGLLKMFEKIIANAPVSAFEEQVEEPAPENEVRESEQEQAHLADFSVTEPTAEAAVQPSDNEMEMRLLELLSQTTSTQEQLRNQQGHMVQAISSHSKQLSEMAKQLERMENTLASKLEAS